MYSAGIPMAVKPAFLTTIDTEGDNLWAHPRAITTANSRYLERFQACCEQYGIEPVYLTDYEMALCPVFAAFGRDLIRRGAAEIGAHLHAWNSPPVRPLTANDHVFCPYLTEFPPGLMLEKFGFLTRLLEDTFEQKMTSHRAGRWAFNGPYAEALISNGYLVDCSVTPGVSWRSSLGDPDGAGGPDYTACPREPYFVSLEDIRRPGDSPLLEVPVSILPTSPAWLDRLRERFPKRSAQRSVLNRLSPPLTWLRPNGGNRPAMLRLLHKALSDGRPCVEFMLHSSELMPAGSPNFPDAASIERLYADLDAVFSLAAGYFRPRKLTEFRHDFRQAAVLGPA
jgi:hypothetical protein